jgi:hypothetical protein
MKTATWIAVLMLLWPAAASAGNCVDVLDHHAYDCRFAQDTGETYAGCVRFTSPGTIGDFDLHAHVEFPSGTSNFDGGCSCDPKGSVKKPQFDAAKTFDCLKRGFGSFVVSGKADGKTIAKGHITGLNGTSVIFSCGPFPKNSLNNGADPCPACVPGGDSCTGSAGPCCAGLTCSGGICQ